MILKNMELDKIYHGDCLKGMSEVPDGSIDLVVTDPPYLIGYRTAWRYGEHKFKHEIANDSGERARRMVIDYIHECYRVLKDNTAAYFFCSSKTSDFFRQACVSTGFAIKNIIVWDKGQRTLGDLTCQYGQSYELIMYCNKGHCPINGKRLSDIWRFKRVPSDKLLHQNQKPTGLIEQCVLKSSARGGVILDGFMGSGTTALACIATGRHYIGWELDDDYYHVASKRIRDKKKNPALFNFDSFE